MKTDTMKAIVCTRYGPPEVLKVQEMLIPSPKANEVLVKVHVGAATTADSMMRRADPFISRFFLGFFRPKSSIIGTGFAGEVVATGSAVRQFKTGDLVFGETGVNFKANAEYICIAVDGVLTTLPKNMSFAEAAPVCDGPLTSMNFLKNIGQIKAGQKVLINGASGSLGTAAIQLARHFGATVTGVCGPTNQELVQSLGAHEVIDYTKTDFTENGQTYDIIYDTIGKLSYSKCKKSLKQHGMFLSPVLKLSLLWQMLCTALVGSKKVKFSATGLLPASELLVLLNEIKVLIENEKLISVIDQQYPMEEVVDAHHHIDSGHKRGNVVLKFAV